MAASLSSFSSKSAAKGFSIGPGIGGSGIGGGGIVDGFAAGLRACLPYGTAAFLLGWYAGGLGTSAMFTICAGFGGAVVWMSLQRILLIFAWICSHSAASASSKCFLPASCSARANWNADIGMTSMTSTSLLGGQSPICATTVFLRWSRPIMSRMPPAPAAVPT